MSLKKFEYRRKPLRLRGYDYSKAGFYFVTICAKDRECLFGKIAENDIYLSELGKIINKQWLKIEDRINSIKLDEYVIMPNHIHGIIQIIPVGATLAVARKSGQEPDPTLAVARKSGQEPDPTLAVARKSGQEPDPTLAVARKSKRAGTSPAPTEGLGKIIGSFKSLCVHQYLVEHKKDPLQKAANIWQRNYYERIIRSDKELNDTRKYIRNNPKNWNIDQENPINI